MTKQLTAADPRDGLPEPAHFLYHDDATGTEIAPPTPLYSADQMRAYAEQCIAHSRPEAVDQKRALERLVGAAGSMLAEIEACGHEVDPTYRLYLHDAWTIGKAALTPERAP